MDQATKDKLDAVKAYLTGLPAKFKALQDKVDQSASNDEADKTKIDELTAEVDKLKADHTDVTGVVDELDAAVKAADEADGDETPTEPPPVEPAPPTPVEEIRNPNG